MTQSHGPKNVVLYADDDIDDIQLVSETFLPYASSVDLITFPDGDALLKHINAMPFDAAVPCLIILDINMPKINGKETLIHIRKIPRLSEVPVVLFSTSTLPSEAAFARSFNAGFITKPLDHHQMENVIEQFIDNCNDEVKEQIRKRKFN